MRFGPPAGLDCGEGFAAYEVGAFVELGVAAEIGFEDVDGVGDLVAVEGHGGFEAEGVARAEAAGQDAEFRAGCEDFVPDAAAGGLVGGDVDLEAVLAGVAGAGDHDVVEAGLP